MHVVILATDGPGQAVEDGVTVKWWNEVSISEMTPTRTRGPQATSDWNWSSDVVTDDIQTLSVGTTMKLNTSVTDIITGQLTSQLISFSCSLETGVLSLCLIAIASMEQIIKSLSSVTFVCDLFSGAVFTEYR